MRLAIATLATATLLTATLLLGSAPAHADLVISPSGTSPQTSDVPSGRPEANNPDIQGATTPLDAPDSEGAGEVILDKTVAHHPHALTSASPTVSNENENENESANGDEAPQAHDETGGVLSDQIASAATRISALPTGAGIPENSPPLRPGSQGRSVTALAQALSAHGFLADDPASTTRFGTAMTDAVKTAQTAYGLQADGIASRQLYVNLNATGDQRQAALTAWQATVAGLVQKAREQGLSKIVIVNVPSFTLRAIDVTSGKTVVQSRVIVGRPERATPLEPIDIVGIKYNPTWTPPPTIMKKDIFPNLGKNAGYFQHHGLIITNAQGQRVSPALITPEQFVAGHYRVQQPAGDENALGILKFETDSRQNIYLHDTNERPVFRRAGRAYSSGCVRVQDWMDLATFVSDQPDATIQKNLDGGRTYIARTPKVPVIFTYSLGDVQNGRPTLFPDVYHRGNAPIIAH